MISIGCDFCGPEHPDTQIGQLLLAAMNVVADLRGDYAEGSIPEVNVVFCVPGSLGDFPHITKIAAGRFSRKQKLLLVEVPVPRDMAESGGSVEFVIDALRQANVIAAEVFVRKGNEPFDLDKANAIVDRVNQTLLLGRKGVGKKRCQVPLIGEEKVSGTFD